MTNRTHTEDSRRVHARDRRRAIRSVREYLLDCVANDNGWGRPVHCGAGRVEQWSALALLLQVDAGIQVGRIMCDALTGRQFTTVAVGAARVCASGVIV